MNRRKCIEIELKVVLAILIFTCVLFGTISEVSAAPQDLLPIEGEYTIQSPVASRTYGVTWLNHESYAMAGHYGFTLKRNRQNPKAMVLETYMLDWNGKDPCGNITIQKLSVTKTGTEGAETLLKSNVKCNEKINIDIPDTGEWTIAWKTEDCIVRGYVTVDNGKAFAMRLNPEEEYTDGEEWEKIKKEINMTEALNGDIPYPIKDMSSPDDIHNEEQIKIIADNIVRDTENKTGKKLTKPEKVFLFIKYIQENYAFDVWRVNKDINKTRAGQLGYDDPMNFAYYSHVGVCWDFSCMLNIMARRHGIPAVGLFTDTHALSALYLNGEWVSFDVAQIINKQCIQQDVSEKLWIERPYAMKWRTVLACDPDHEGIWLTYSMCDNTKQDAEKSNAEINLKYQ